MATVPFAERRTTIAPRDATLDTTRASDASIGEGLQALGGGMRQLASAAVDLGKRTAARTKQTRTMAALTPVMEAAGKRMNQFRALRGSQVNEASVKQFEEDLAALKAQHGSGLQGDEKELFDARVEDAFSSLRVDADGHRTKQQAAFAEEARVASRDSAADNFASDPLSKFGEAEFNRAMASAWDPTASDEKNRADQEAAASRAVGGAVDAILRQPNPDVDAAKRLIGDKGRWLPEVVKARLAEAVTKAEDRRDDNTFVAETIKSVQAQIPASQETPDPSVFTKQELEGEKQIEAAFVDGKITREQRDARLSAFRSVVGDARTATLRKIQEDEAAWAPKVLEERSAAAREARIRQAPEYLQPTLRRLSDQQSAREAGKPTTVTDKAEIDRRESLVLSLMRTQVRPGGAYQNEAAVEVDARRMNLPDESIVRLKNAFRNKGEEIVKGVTVSRIQGALANALGRKPSDIPDEEANAVFLNVSAAWPEDKAYDPITLTKLVNAQVMKVRAGRGQDTMRAYEAIQKGLESTMRVVDEDILADERSEMEALHAAAMADYRAEKDPVRAETLLKRAKEFNPDPVGPRGERLEVDEFEREKASIMSRRLGLIPGRRMQDSMNVRAARGRAAIQSVIDAAEAEAQAALDATRSRVTDIVKGTEDQGER